MQVLNRQERSTAYFWFLLFFIITVGLFVLAVFFNFQVPARENAELRKELSTFRQEQAFQSDFLQKMERVKTNLDSMNAPNQNAAFMDQTIAADLSAMRNSIPKSAVTHYALYDNFVQICLSFQQSKQQLRGLQNAQQNIAELKQQVQDLTRDLEQTRRDLDYYRSLQRSTTR